MSGNFELSERLKSYLSFGASYPVYTLGERFPVSIRQRYRWSQSIVIYPESDYSFFMYSEAVCLLSLAKSLNLDSAVHSENGVPVIEVTDYNVNDL